MASNKLIIGENKQVLTLGEYLDDSYKVIYLDPPYNTLTTKSYSDCQDGEKWMGQLEERLILCKGYLKEDGVIFISIDDSEFATVRFLCDKIFSKNNFLGTFVTRQATRSNSKFINTIHEYVVCYAKNKTKLKPWKVRRIDTEDGVWMQKLLEDVRTLWKTTGEAAAYELLKNFIKNSEHTWLRNYNLIDQNGDIFFASDLSTPNNPRTVNIPEIDLHLEPLPKRGWTSDARFIELHNKGLLYYRNGRPYEKKYLIDSEDNCQSILNFYSRHGTKDLKDLGLDGVFDTPKSVELLKYLFRFVLNPGDNVLDIYAGSGSTAQACTELDENISWALIQQEEEVDVKSPVYKNCKKLNIKPTIQNILKTRLNAISANYENFYLRNV